MKQIAKENEDERARRLMEVENPHMMQEPGQLTHVEDDTHHVPMMHGHHGNIPRFQQ